MSSSFLRARRRRHTIEPCSHEDVLWHDVRALLGHGDDDADNADPPFRFREEIEFVVDRLASTGHALGRHSGWVVAVPFALPGERVRVRVYRHARRHVMADLVAVIAPNDDLRNDDRVQCKYFGRCSGCQYQMLAYDKQLEIKRDVVVNAYNNFADLPPDAVPTVLSTVASPKQYHYRTKITPHFEAPPKKAPPSSTKPDWLHIGFNEAGKKTVVDIEECPIATPVLNQALAPIRERIIQNIWSYKKGVSLLLRDSLDPDDPAQHVCITDHKATVRERVGNTRFEFPGHAFFQNNNSILGPLTDHVRDAIFPSALADDASPTHLVDTYCGSGFFSILLSPHFDTVTGIELSSDAIRAATANAALNHIPADKCTFVAGDASDVFATVSHLPRAKTVVIVDPPRKGCDQRFLDQLLAFGPGTVVYVSCNVHTQARDVGAIVKRSKNAGTGQRYVLESLRGFDLFPQTAHVESVAVLRLVD